MINIDNKNIVEIDKSKNLFLFDVPQRTDEWFVARRLFLTASEMPELMISFINKKSFMRNNRADFARYKLGQKEKEFSEFQQALMNKGKLNEHIAIAEIKKMLDEYNLANPNELMEMWPEPVFLKDNWALASTDCMLYTKTLKGPKLIAPVEIKYTESKNTFTKYLNKDHYNFYQLAFQMYVTDTKIGYMTITLNVFGEDIRTRTLKIDRDSSYYKEVEKSIKELKSIHKTICIDKENPYLKLEAKAYLSAITLNDQEKLLNNIEKKLSSALVELTDKKNKFDSINKNVEMFKSELLMNMDKAGTFYCKLKDDNIQYILCESTSGYKYIMSKKLKSQTD